MLEYTLWGNSLSQWLLAFFIIIVAIILSRLVYRLFTRIFRHLSTRTRSRLDDLIIDYVEEPVILLIILVGLHFSLTTVKWPELAALWINRAFPFTYALIFSWMIIRIYDAFDQGYLQTLIDETSTDVDDQLFPIMRTGVRTSVWVVGILMGLSNAGYDVAALIASLGIGGVAVALAAKDTVANAFGGITIFLQQPFAIGDQIKIAGITGWVREIGLRTSTLETNLGRDVTIPNSLFTNSPIENIDSEPFHYVSVELSLQRDTHVDKAEQALALLQQIAIDNPHVENVSWASLETIGKTSLDIVFWYAIKNWHPSDEATLGDPYHKKSIVKTQMNLAILQTLAQNDIRLVGD
ncbi:MAG TPA: mechanosensitive ion channel family protein [Anaerolineae bacterium]|nr:mechanosensitive ion channel family protein [Anaerolineae bacterium]